jgi:hypothetical protein
MRCLSHPCDSAQMPTSSGKAVVAMQPLSVHDIEHGQLLLSRSTGNAAPVLPHTASQTAGQAPLSPDQQADHRQKILQWHKQQTCSTSMLLGQLLPA